jgi:hypothetical protein
MNTVKSICWPALSALALAVVCAATPVHAQERESLEALRQTTLDLINALVETGAITRDKADALIRAAQEKAAKAAASPTPVTAEGKPVIRVPYVPESMRAQIRSEVKEEILEQARAERWGVPNLASSWADRIKIEGDIRVRYQQDNPGRDNTTGATYLAIEEDAANATRGAITRAPDFASFVTRSADGRSLSTANTTESVGRERLRLRLGLSAKVTDEVGVGLRLATGNATDRVSTNQTLGQDFNKYQIFVDRAFVRLDPADWLTVQAGRIPNPWFSTEMAWSDNLNFEGLATTARYSNADASFSPFFTLGYFPLRSNQAPRAGSRHLVGAQLGTTWDLDSRTRLKFGAALYDYHNIEGRSDADFTDGTNSSNQRIPLIGATYGQYEYGSSLRQKGNTLFKTAPVAGYPDVRLQPVWGLAYKFRPLVLTASAAFSHFSPFNLLLSAEYANNLAFSKSDFNKRATDAALLGVNPGGRREGYQLKLAVGDFEVRDFMDWQVQFNYRHVGSDAVLDAFTDSDLGLGGTNVRGYSLGLTYGLYRNTNLGVRYLAAENIDTTINPLFPNGRYQVNTLQVDLNVRF